MADKTLNWAERRRLELDRDRRSQPRSPLIAAVSSAEIARTHAPGIQAGPFGPGNPRFAYLTRSYD